MAVSPPLAVACYLKAHILCTVRECCCPCHKRVA